MRVVRFTLKKKHVSKKMIYYKRFLKALAFHSFIYNLKKRQFKCLLPDPRVNKTFIFNNNMYMEINQIIESALNCYQLLKVYA